MSAIVFGARGGSFQRRPRQITCSGVAAPSSALLRRQDGRFWVAERARRAARECGGASGRPAARRCPFWPWSAADRVESGGGASSEAGGGSIFSPAAAVFWVAERARRAVRECGGASGRPAALGGQLSQLNFCLSSCATISSWVDSPINYSYHSSFLGTSSIFFKHSFLLEGKEGRGQELLLDSLPSIFFARRPQAQLENQGRGLVDPGTSALCFLRSSRSSSSTQHHLHIFSPFRFWAAASPTREPRQRTGRSWYLCLVFSAVEP